MPTYRKLVHDWAAENGCRVDIEIDRWVGTREFSVIAPEGSSFVATESAAVSYGDCCSGKRAEYGWRLIYDDITEGLACCQDQPKVQLFLFV